MPKNIEVIIREGGKTNSYSMNYDNLCADEGQRYQEKVFESISQAFATVNGNQRLLCPSTSLTDYFCHFNPIIDIAGKYENDPESLSFVDDENNPGHKRIIVNCETNYDRIMQPVIEERVATTMARIIDTPDAIIKKSSKSNNSTLDEEFFHSSSSLFKLAMKCDSVESIRNIKDSNSKLLFESVFSDSTKSPDKFFAILLRDKLAKKPNEPQLLDIIGLSNGLANEYIKGPVAIDMMFRNQSLSSRGAGSNNYDGFVEIISDQNASMGEERYVQINQILDKDPDTITDEDICVIKEDIQSAISDIKDKYLPLARGDDRKGFSR